MSSYQYYDFYAIDRPLSKDEIDEVSGFSSRVNPTSRRATFEYNYSDFRYNEEEVLAKYFDIFLYVSSWGNRRLMMKFPADLVSESELKAYEIEAEDEFVVHLSAFRKDSHVIIDFNYCNDCGDWIDAEGMLEDLIPLRAQILNGDYRVLYLAWLHLVSLNFQDEDLKEPKVPDNLKNLDYPLENFIQFWQINEDLVSAVSEFSDATEEITPEDLLKRLANVSETEKDEFLALLLTDELRASIRLKKRLLEMGPSESYSTKNPRSLGEIQERQLHYEKERISKRKKEAEEARIRRMAKIKRDEAEIWVDAKSNAELKSGTGYKKATELLKELKDYHDYIGEQALFDQKLGTFLDNYGQSLAFRKRLKSEDVF